MVPDDNRLPSSINGPRIPPEQLHHRSQLLQDTLVLGTLRQRFLVLCTGQVSDWTGI